MPSPKPPLAIKFDFRHLVPGQDLNSNSLSLEGSNCFGQSLAVTILAENLIPGHFYKTEYSLISPVLPNQPFNPASSNLYASYNYQNFVTSLNLPSQNDPLSSSVYILKATTTDITEGFNEVASRQLTLTCGPSQKDFEVQILDSTAPTTDNIIDLENCDNPIPLVGVIKNAVVGQEYSYEFYDNPVGGITFEKKKGDIYAGDINQNFNSKIALTGYPYVFVHAEVKDKSSGISRISEPVLLKCFQTNECDVVLPTGVDVAIGGAKTFRKCSQNGLTNQSITSLSGGKGFSIGDKLTTVGGGGYGAEIEVLFGGITTDTFSSLTGCSGLNIGDLIEITGGGGSDGLIKIISGGLTTNSIISLSGCAGYKVGDHLTTIGGGGKDAIITVSSTGLNGSITSYNLTNSGYGFTNVPTGVISLNGSGSCAIASFNEDNFTVPLRGGITQESADIYGGSGYNIGEVLDLIGGGGSNAQVKILSGSLTAQSIDSLSGGTGYSIGDYLSLSGGSGSDSLIRVSATGSAGAISGYELLNGGHSFVSAPTGITRLTGSGSGATLSANSDNFSITSVGSITKLSANNLINSGSGYSVGSQLIAIGGGGSGAVIEITSVNNNGGILDFVIKNGGHQYSSSPIIINDSQIQISSQITWNISKFTSRPYVIINSGSGYINSPTIISSNNGNGTGAIFNFTPDRFIGYSFIVINAGSGYTSAPTGIIVRSGDGGCLSASFNDDNFTIPCAGGITYESVNNLIGKTSFIIGEELVVEGGEGSGARIKVTGVNNGAITSFVILNAGCGYVSEPTLKKLNGTIIPGVTFDTNDFTDLAFNVINPGIGFTESPTGLQVLTGDGRVDDIVVLFNDDNFVEIIGPPPTPSSTPTPTVTPSISPPVQCDDLQSAGGVNQQYSTKLAVDATSGQNYIIVEDVSGLSQYSIVTCSNIAIDGISPGTYITKVENWFANFDERTLYKKLTLSNNLTANISINTIIDIYVTDIRMIKVPYWPGNMNFLYDAYGVPDRFRVFAVPIDNRLSDILLFDSGYRGASPCGYANTISGPGSGNIQLTKPDGCIFIKVVVEAPCEGTAWEYSVSCPQRIFTTITQTPTTTPTRTPTATVTNTPTPSPTRP